MIKTTRLNLLPFELKLVEATLNGRNELEQLLDIEVPEEWPSENYAKILPSKREQLLAVPETSKWSRIAVDREINQLVGEIGCKGGPDENGVIEIGYGVAESFRNKGYATEMVRGLVKWLVENQLCTKVVANCLETNESSMNVLKKSGFQQTYKADGLIYWELK